MLLKILQTACVTEKEGGLCVDKRRACVEAPRRANGQPGWPQAGLTSLASLCSKGFLFCVTVAREWQDQGLVSSSRAARSCVRESGCERMLRKVNICILISAAPSQSVS